MFRNLKPATIAEVVTLFVVASVVSGLGCF